MWITLGLVFAAWIIAYWRAVKVIYRDMADLQLRLLKLENPEQAAGRSLTFDEARKRKELDT